MTRQEFSNQLVSLRSGLQIGKNEITRLCDWTFLTTDRIEKASNNYSLQNAFKYIKALNGHVQISYPDLKRVKHLTSAEEWSKVIFDAIEESNMSRCEIERISGIKQATLSFLKNGKQSWHIDRALLMMDMLGIRVTVQHDK